MCLIYMSPDLGGGGGGFMIERKMRRQEFKLLSLRDTLFS